MGQNLGIFWLCLMFYNFVLVDSVPRYQYPNAQDILPSSGSDFCRWNSHKGQLKPVKECQNGAIFKTAYSGSLESWDTNTNLNWDDVTICCITALCLQDDKSSPYSDFRCMNSDQSNNCRQNEGVFVPNLCPDLPDYIQCCVGVPGGGSAIAEVAPGLGGPGPEIPPPTTFVNPIVEEGERNYGVNPVAGFGGFNWFGLLGEP